MACITAREEGRAAHSRQVDVSCSVAMMGREARLEVALKDGRSFSAS